MPAILTFDLGTTYFKAALFDQEGTLRALHRLAPPISKPRPGWMELAAEQFLQALGECVTALRTAAPATFSDVAAITFATQTNSFLLLGPSDVPLTPVILWPDGRAADFDDAVQHLARAPGFRATTGLPRLGPEFMAAKLLWLHAEHSDVLRSTRRLCLISDFLTLYFTGRHITEAGTAGLTGLLDIHTLQWWSDAVATLPIDVRWLPEVLRAGSDVGVIRSQVASELGLPDRCRFVLGCLDQYAGAIGAGNLLPGGVSETTGTVLSTIRCANTFMEKPPPGVFQGPSFDPRIYFQMCFGSTSANLLEWYTSHLADSPGLAVLDAEAAQAPPGASGLRVRPGAAQAAGISDGFIGWTAQHTRGHAVRAIMEAVAFALAEQVCTLCTSRRPLRIQSSGGAARSDVWLQIKADVLGVPFVAGVCPEPTSLGAAMLAAQALKWGHLAVLGDRWARPRCELLPDAAHHAQYSLSGRA